MPVSRAGKLSNPLSDEEINRLSDILDSFPNEDAMTIEMLDGFFTALHCCPTLVPPSRYMHRIYGNEEDDASGAPFENEEQFHHFYELLMRHWNGIGSRLRREDLEPILEDAPDMGTNWSIGFLEGVTLAEGNPESMMRDRDESMAFMSFFLLAFGNKKWYGDLPPMFDDEITSEMRKEVLESLPSCVMFLYHRFRDSRANVSTAPAHSPKPGRNDLCHCGSGKKYKKCCLNKTIH